MDKPYNWIEITLREGTKFIGEIVSITPDKLTMLALVTSEKQVYELLNIIDSNYTYCNVRRYSNTKMDTKVIFHSAKLIQDNEWEILITI